MAHDNKSGGQIGQNSVLNQVLRQCKHIRDPLDRKDLNPIIQKHQAIEDLKTEIRKYKNNSDMRASDLQEAGWYNNSPGSDRHSPASSMRQSKDINRQSPGWGVHSALRKNLETQGTQVTQDVIKRPFVIGSSTVKKIDDMDFDMVLDNQNSRVSLH